MTQRPHKRQRVEIKLEPDAQQAPSPVLAHRSKVHGAQLRHTRSVEVRVLVSRAAGVGVVVGVRNRAAAAVAPADLIR